MYLFCSEIVIFWKNGVLRRKNVKKRDIFLDRRFRYYYNLTNNYVSAQKYMVFRKLRFIPINLNFLFAVYGVFNDKHNRILVKLGS